MTGLSELERFPTCTAPTGALCSVPVSIVSLAVTLLASLCDISFLTTAVKGFIARKRPFDTSSTSEADESSLDESCQSPEEICAVMTGLSELERFPTCTAPTGTSFSPTTFPGTVFSPKV